MKRICLAAAIILLVAGFAAAADPSLVDGISGAPFAWNEWVERHGPAAVLVWASWVPEADRLVARTGEISAAAERRGLSWMLVDVQEPLPDARQALADVDFSWVHDRHGSLLKLYRVFEVPAIVIVSADNTVLGIVEADAGALEAWRPR
jgi:hypothetical protein